jgi:hypothetical protein
MLKSKAELRKLPAGSKDIYKKGILDRYSERPRELKKMCLADFVALFNFKRFKARNEEENETENVDNVEDLSLNGGADELADSGWNDEYKLRDGTLRRRRQPKVIRFCRFDFHKDPQNFFRERLMLFHPWEDEERELEELTREELEAIYTQHRDQIEANTRRYIKIDVDLTELLTLIVNQRAGEEIEEESLYRDEDQQPINVFDYDESLLTTDVFNEIGEPRATTSTDPTPAAGEVNRVAIPDQLNDHDYYDIVNSLNEKQQDYLMHVLSCFKLGEIPFYHFISGEAGVGKSRLIKAIYQTLIRYFRRNEGSAEKTEIALVAYTGKAAHNIEGVTSHHAFNLALVSENVSAETLNTLRVKLSHLEVVVMDEISMTGKKTFNKINTRMCKVFGSERPFGGKSVIVLGDFYQLPPVKDPFVFAPDKDPVRQMVGNLLWQQFKLFELTEIMRQRDDVPFAQALGRLGKGLTTPEDEQLFRSRCFADTNEINSGKPILPDEAKNAVRLMWRHRDVDAYNNKRLRELGPSSAFTYKILAFDNVVGNPTPAEKALVKNNLAQLDLQGHTKTNGLCKNLIVQAGIRYMITANIDVADGLFNGATGICRYIEVIQSNIPNASQDEIATPTREKYGAVYLEFDDPKVGAKARENRRNIMSANPSINNNWTPITPLAISFQVTKRKINAQVRNYL